MSFPGPNQPPSNGGGNKPNGGNNPFTNPFSRNNDGKNGGSGANGNKSNGPRPFWQSPWLWVVVVALLAVILTDETEAPRAFVTVHVAFAVERPATRLPDNPPLFADIAPHDTDGLIADVLIVIFAEPVFVPISVL